MFRIFILSKGVNIYSTYILYLCIFYPLSISCFHIESKACIIQFLYPKLGLTMSVSACIIWLIGNACIKMLIICFTV